MKSFKRLEKKTRFTIVAVVSFLVIALVIGLSVGLSMQGKSNSLTKESDPKEYDKKKPSKFQKERSGVDDKKFDKHPKGKYVPEPLYPEKSHVCDKELTIVLTGYMGNGKSTLVNTLAGYFDPRDSRNPVAVTSTFHASCTLESKWHNVQSFGVGINVLDTQGIETDQAKNIQITKAAVEAINKVDSGFDAMMILVKADERLDIHLMKDFLEFVDLVADETSYGRIVFVFTHAENISPGEEDDQIRMYKQKYIDEFGEKAELLMNQASFVFGRQQAYRYRDDGKMMEINSVMAKVETGKRIIEAAHRICKANNGEGYTKILDIQRRAEEAMESHEKLLKLLSELSEKKRIFISQKEELSVPALKQFYDECMQNIEFKVENMFQIAGESNDAHVQRIGIELETVVKNYSCISAVMDRKKQLDQNRAEYQNYKAQFEGFYIPLRESLNKAKVDLQNLKDNKVNGIHENYVKPICSMVQQVPHPKVAMVATVTNIISHFASANNRNEITRENQQIIDFLDPAIKEFDKHVTDLKLEEYYNDKTDINDFTLSDLKDRQKSFINSFKPMLVFHSQLTTLDEMSGKGQGKEEGKEA